MTAFNVIKFKAVNYFIKYFNTKRIYNNVENIQMYIFFLYNLIKHKNKCLYNLKRENKKGKMQKWRDLFEVHEKAFTK